MFLDLAIAGLAAVIVRGPPMSSPDLAPPLAPGPSEVALELSAPPPCDDVLRLIARGFGGELRNMRLTRDPQWGLIWRGDLRIADGQGAQVSRVVCASGRGAPLAVDAAWRDVAAAGR